MFPKRLRATEKHAGGNSIFVDTSAWMALFTRRDQYHGDADRIFRQAVASKRQLLTTNLVLAETHRLASSQGWHQGSSRGIGQD